MYDAVPPAYLSLHTLRLSSAAVPLIPAAAGQRRRHLRWRGGRADSQPAERDIAAAYMQLQYSAPDMPSFMTREEDVTEDINSHFRVQLSARSFYLSHYFAIARPSR